MPSFLSPLIKEPETSFVLRNARTGECLADRLEPAFDSATRNRGLLGRDGLDRGSALILAPCASVHTWFMRFPIDVVFVKKTGEVAKVRSAVGPWRIAVALRRGAASGWCRRAPGRRHTRAGRKRVGAMTKVNDRSERDWSGRNQTLCECALLHTTTIGGEWPERN